MRYTVHYWKSKVHTSKLYSTWILNCNPSLWAMNTFFFFLVQLVLQIPVNTSTQKAKKWSLYKSKITIFNVHLIFLSIMAPVRWGRRWCMQPLVPHWRRSLEEDTLKMKCLAQLRLVKSLELTAHQQIFSCWGRSTILSVCPLCRTTCAFRDTCDICPPPHPQLRSQQLSRNYNALKSQR